MTEEEFDYCLSCESTEGFEYKKTRLNIVGGFDINIHIYICDNCGYIHMYKPMRRKRKKPFAK